MLQWYHDSYLAAQVYVSGHILHKELIWLYLGMATGRVSEPVPEPATLPAGSRPVSVPVKRQTGTRLRALNGFGYPRVPVKRQTGTRLQFFIFLNYCKLTFFFGKFKLISDLK